MTEKIKKSRILLFFPFSRLPLEAEEIIERLSAASGIAPEDIRYKLVGRGLTRLTPDIDAEKQEACLAEMRDTGIPAALVTSEAAGRRFKLPLAKSVEISENSVVFFDRNEHAVFTVDKNTDLLVIAADLSGKTTDKAHLALQFNTRPGPKGFEESLKKISLFKPVAIFVRTDGASPSGVFVDHSSFAYPSLKNHMSMSASVNFRTLVSKTIERAKTSVTDHEFGTASIAGAIPDWSGSKREILACLNRYTRFILAAAEAGLLRDGSTVSAEDSYTKKKGVKEKAKKKQSDTASAYQAYKKPLPPPEIKHSGLAGLLAFIPYEIVHALIFFLILAAWFFLNASGLDHPVFWKTAAGILLVSAGVLIFSYSLLAVYYKRMVKNIPTARIRSVAMGMAELEGRARQYFELRSPHSRTACIYYRCVYYRRVRTSKGGKWRIDKILYSGKLPFYLEDETGKILIRPKGSLMLAEKSRQEFWGGQNMWLSADLQDRDIRIYEDVIADGSRIYVLGSAGTERTGSDYKEKLISRLRELKSNRGRLMKYDTNKNGRIDETEWENARKDMENIVHAETLTADSGPGEQLVIKKPGYGMLPFMIAKSESDIIRKLALRIWLFMTGGLFMAGLGTEILIRLYTN